MFEKMFKLKSLYVELAKNQILVRDLDTKQEIIRKSVVPFSNERLMIADFQIAHNFLLELISELFIERSKIFKKSFKTVVFISDPNYHPICEVEKRIYRDLMEITGSKSFSIHTSKNKPSEIEIIALLSK